MSLFPIQVEEDNYKSVGCACFLKTVYQNEKCLKSKINICQHVKQKLSIFSDQLFLLFRKRSGIKK